jgi:hypothetical protein
MPVQAVKKYLDACSSSKKVLGCLCKQQKSIGNACSSGKRVLVITNNAYRSRKKSVGNAC